MSNYSVKFYKDLFSSFFNNPVNR